MANLIGGSGVNARKVQIKAQAAQAPKKLGNYLKKKFKREKDRENRTDSSSSTSSGSKDDDEGLRSDEETDSEEDSPVKQEINFETQVEELSETVTITRL